MAMPASSRACTGVSALNRRQLHRRRWRMDVNTRVMVAKVYQVAGRELKRLRGDV
jgi:hypothetical protein